MLPCGIVMTGREHNVECSDGIKCQKKFLLLSLEGVYVVLSRLIVTCTLSSRLTPVMIRYALVADEFIKHTQLTSLQQSSSQTYSK